MPKNPESEGDPILLTIDQIAEKHRVSRSSVHTYRRGGTFPRPVPVEGTTRVRFDAAEVAAWFEANPKRQGTRNDLPAKKKPKQGVPVTTTTVDARKDLYAFAMDGKEHSPAISDRASEKIDAFRAAVIDEVVEALQSQAAELSAEAEEEMRRDLEEQAQEWHRAADVAAKLKRTKAEASDG